MSLRAMLCGACCLMLVNIPALAQDSAKPEAKQPEAKKPQDGAKPGAGKADAGKPDAGKPAAGKPEAGKMPEGMPSPDEMMKMMEQMGAPGENHKLLEAMVGEWDAASKFYMDPTDPAKATETKGVSKQKTIMGGRFIQQDFEGEFMGKPFSGMGLTGYDNVKKEYVGIWIDSMGTSIMTSTGKYDPATKSFTFMSEMDNPMAGGKCKIREVVRIVDKDKHTFEWFETGPDGKETKSFEITYTRRGAASKS